MLEEGLTGPHGQPFLTVSLIPPSSLPLPSPLFPSLWAGLWMVAEAAAEKRGERIHALVIVVVTGGQTPAYFKWSPMGLLVKRG